MTINNSTTHIADVMFLVSIAGLMILGICLLIANKLMSLKRRIDNLEDRLSSAETRIARCNRDFNDLKHQVSRKYIPTANTVLQ